ncbi:hypothetical protein F5X68DRAFT_230303 [Plectosphaerella plurivora]|uniref:Uncharacterized protein n=1 Tax=Plectosphaerella plurivora TaxID=936078 RepID=A0A9P9A9Y9_9PEZI|nr:hypothetical protein F5X68DRAFT_230303 [Plectosphaerella plurivora]
MEYFDNPRVLETTEKADEYKKAQNLPNLMGRSYLAPNSLRGTVFQAPVNSCSKEPFSHGNLDTYLRKIGAGKLWPMPKVVGEKEAKALTDFWRKKAQDAYKEFAPVALNFADVFNEHFQWMFQAETAVGTVGDSGDGGENQLPYNLSGLIGRAWEAVMNRDEFKDFFGAETKLPEHAGAGFDAWTQAFQRVELHQSTARVGLEKQVTEVPVAVYNFTPSKSETQPDFTDYEEHCKKNKLAYLIPWLNLEDLALPEGVANMILSRAMNAPPTFARSDWNAMQVGRSGRLLLEPYCDSCFMDFYKPPMVLNNSPSSEYFTGANSHGILIVRPSMSDILGKHKTSHNLGQIFGWGDGLLILQAQATILRFCAEITKLMVRCHVTDEKGRARSDLDVVAGKPKFLSLHHSFPVEFKIPEVPWDLNSFKAQKRAEVIAEK